MDKIDKKILQTLQDDVGISQAKLADRVHLSKTACWRRVQILEKAGVIKRKVALLDRSKLDRMVDVFVFIKTNQHNADWFEQFKQAVDIFPEIMEFYRMSGEVDYLMRVVVEDMAAYDRFYKRLIKKIDLSDVSSHFAMEQIKYTTALPL